MVYGREFDEEPVTFGTSGYTLDNTFVLYDRASGSVWYPTDENHLEATSGVLKGKRIEFLDKPTPMSLAQWRKLHPETKVLLPDKRKNDDS